MDQIQPGAVLDFPLRPVLTFRVGVVGHRLNRLDTNKIPELQEQIRELLIVIRETAQCVQTRVQAYAAGPAVLRIISPLAEGTDRLAARAALELGFELQCPMPFFEEEFKNDFHRPDPSGEGSVREFDDLLSQAERIGNAVKFEMDGVRGNDAAAYASAGNVVLNQSDVLIVVWDGKPAAGKGGTVETLNRALAYRVPVVWIDPFDPKRWQLLRTPSDLRGAREEPFEQGTERGTRFVPSFSQAELDDFRNDIRHALEPRPPSGHGAGTKRASEFDRTTLATYLKEGRPKQNWGFFWKFFRDVLDKGRARVSFRVEPFEQAVATEWRSEDDGTPFGKWISDRLLSFYAWSDKLADDYADAYRSSFIIVFLFGGFAVFFALVGPAAHWSDARRVLEIGSVVCELALIGLIIFLIWRGQKKHWHARWLAYRVLAELLRQLRFLAPLGGGRPFPRLSPYLAEYGDPSQMWMYWHFRAVERQIGLPKARIDAGYLCHYAGFLARLVDGQIAFHRRNRERSNKIETRLRLMGESFFWLTLLACILHLYLFRKDVEIFPRWLVLAAAVFPAFGAALAAIRNHGEFHRLEMRSAAMEVRLDHIKAELTHLRGQPPASHAMSSMTLVTLGLRTVQLMVDEVLDWRVIFLDRPLERPA